MTQRGSVHTGTTVMTYGCVIIFQCVTCITQIYDFQQLPRVFYPVRGNSVMDALDAQWECEGELIPLALSDLNPRESQVYQHGLFLIEAMNRLTLVSANVYPSLEPLTSIAVFCGYFQFSTALSHVQSNKMILASLVNA